MMHGCPVETLFQKAQPILCMITDANRDPELRSDPNSFDITRKPSPNVLTFGRGVHHCLGKALALTEIRIALTTLLKRFPKIHVPPGYQIEWHDHFTTFRVIKNPTVLLK